MKPPREFSVLVLDIGSDATSALTRGGFAVTRVQTGEEALQSIRRRPFDLVLLDMSIPGWNGLEACWRIREFAPGTKIIMVAAPDAEEDRARAIEAGADDCVNHPLHLLELVARARAVLRLSSPKVATQPDQAELREFHSPLATDPSDESELPKIEAATEPSTIATRIGG
jgi:DNA-binding response OmpR family regulator